MQTIAHQVIDDKMGFVDALIFVFAAAMVIVDDFLDDEEKENTGQDRAEHRAHVFRSVFSHFRQDVKKHHGQKRAHGQTHERPQKPGASFAGRKERQDSDNRDQADYKSGDNGIKQHIT